MRYIAAILMLTMFLTGCDRSDENKSTSADQRQEQLSEITVAVEVDAPGINVELYCDNAVAASGVTRNSNAPHDADELPADNQPTYVATLRTPIKQGTHVLRIKAVGYDEWERPLEVVGDHHFDVKLIKE